jgi:hypothetical protein
MGPDGPGRCPLADSTNQSIEVNLLGYQRVFNLRSHGRVMSPMKFNTRALRLTINDG